MAERDSQKQESNKGQKGSEGVLSNKEAFEHTQADEKLKQMGEKTKEAERQK